ncbi:unnamed protein product, partial [Phaeothamnion confervicola]
MDMATVDIKLELQMRGVEHRDAFEKLDLAQRLAAAREAANTKTILSAREDDD